MKSLRFACVNNRTLGTIVWLSAALAVALGALPLALPWSPGDRYRFTAAGLGLAFIGCGLFWSRGSEAKQPGIWQGTLVLLQFLFLAYCLTVALILHRLPGPFI
jgi:hypothetical protein